LAAATPKQNTSQSINETLAVNINLGTLILERLTHLNIRPNFINIGTGWQHYLGKYYEPVDLYAATKQAFEDILHYYCKVKGFNAISLHFFDTYGENDVRKKLLNLLLNQKTNEHLELTPGEQIISLLHVDDVVDAILTAHRILSSSTSNNIEKFSLISKDMLSIRDLLAKLSTYGIKPKVSLGAKPYREREIMNPVIPLPPLPTWQQKRNLSEYLEKLSNQNDPN